MLRETTIRLVVIAGFALCSPASAERNGQMMDPALDNPEKEWCYSPMSTTVIGVPFSRPTQVLFDGSLFTETTEVCFLYGKPLKPMFARQKTFLKGWMPIVVYDWNDGDIHYDIEIMSVPLKELGMSGNPLQMIRLRMKNNGDRVAEGTFAVAQRAYGGHPSEKARNRWGTGPVGPMTSYTAESGKATRRERLIFTYSGDGKAYAVPGVPYARPFRAHEYNITDRAEVTPIVYSRKLEPGKSFSAEFKMPQVPILVGDEKTVAAIKEADYDVHRAKTIAFWEGLIEGHVQFSFPEKRVNDSWKASLVHLILATRGGENAKRRRQGSGLPYEGLFLNDYVDMRLAYDCYGLYDFVDVNTQWLLDKQAKDGMFIDHSLSGSNAILASHGQALFSLAHHCFMAPDKESAEKVYPTVLKGAQWVLEEHRKNKNGLLRPSIPYDNEMVIGHYTSHNLWGILGLRTTIRLANSLGKAGDAETLLMGHDSYMKSVLKAMDWTIKDKGYIAPGLYEYRETPKEKGFWNFGHDWENNMLVYLRLPSWDGHLN